MSLKGTYDFSEFNRPLHMRNTATSLENFWILYNLSFDADRMHQRIGCSGTLQSFDLMLLNQHDININKEEIKGMAKTRNRKAMNKYL